MSKSGSHTVRHTAKKYMNGFFLATTGKNKYIQMTKTSTRKGGKN